MLIIAVLEGGMMHRGEPIYWSDGDELPPQLDPEELETDQSYDAFQDAFRDEMEFLDRLTDDDRFLLLTAHINPYR